MYSMLYYYCTGNSRDVCEVIELFMSIYSSITWLIFIYIYIYRITLFDLFG